jgi:hypothetical protein|tara:strand:+ start:8757 stop:9050 length:294 start_codon:yes stop_codon:yes gene_type:complete
MKKNNMKRIRRLDSLPSMSHFETSYGARGILLKKDDMQNMVWWYYQPPTDDKTVREYYLRNNPIGIAGGTQIIRIRKRKTNIPTKWLKRNDKTGNIV